MGQPEDKVHALAMVEPRQTNALTLGALTFSDDNALIAAATSKATALKKVVVGQNLVTRIQGRDYVQVEGWVTLAALCGLIPHVVECEEREDGSYLATVELRDHHGHVKGRADAECGDETDRPWCQRPKYARRSMAQTRATGKACRLALSWVMTMSGYAATPAEEMPPDDDTPQRAPSRAAGGPSDAQVKRLWAIAKEHGWQRSEVGDVIKGRWGLDSTTGLARAQYDELCNDVLPLGPAREGELVDP